MNFQSIIAQHNKIETVSVSGTTVLVNGVSYKYKHAKVAQVVAEKVSYFKGL